MSIDRFARQVMEELTRANIGWALLHEPPVDFGEWSDCDIACDRPGPQLLRDLQASFDALGWYPVTISYYDIGRGDAIWIWSIEDCELLHLDVLCDPTGMGRLAISTAPLLSEAVKVDGLPVASPEWRDAYQSSKNVSKGLQSASKDILPAPPTTDVLGHEQLAGGSLKRGTAARRFGPRILRWRMLVGRVRRHGWLRLSHEWLGRVRSRVFLPAGRWIHVAGPCALAGIDLIRAQLGPAIPVVVRRARRPWLAVVLGFHLLRPRILVTWAEGVGQNSRLPDAILHADADSDLAADPVSSLCRDLSLTTYRRIQ